MLRNVSFAFLFYAMLPIVDLIKYGFSIWQGLAAIGSSLACAFALKQAIKFDRWFYLSIYETVAALKLKSEHIPIEFNSYQSSTSSETREPVFPSKQ